MAFVIPAGLSFDRRVTIRERRRFWFRRFFEPIGRE